MKIFLLNLFFLLTIQYSSAQKFTFAAEGSLWENESQFSTNNIIGKIGNRYLIHIHFISFSKNESRFYLYDSSMQLISVEKANIPDYSPTLYSICYPKFAYIFYQYTANNSNFLEAIKFDSSGKIAGNPIRLIAGNLPSRYFHNQSPGFNIYNYSIINSEDKSKIAVFTIGDLDDSKVLTLFIFNQKLEKIYEKKFKIPTFGPDDAFHQLKINNAGDFIFLKLTGFKDKYPAKFLLNYIKFNSDDVQYYDITPLKVRLNNAAIYADNSEEKIHIYSIYTDSSLDVYSSDIPLGKAKNKSGLFYAAWDIGADQPTDAQLIPFSNFIGAYANDSEFMSLPVQRLSVNNFFQKASGGFILQGNSTRANFFVADSSSYTTIQPINNPGKKSIFNRKPYYSTIPSVNKLYFNRDDIDNLFFFSINEVDSISQFTYVHKFKSGNNIATIKTREGIHYLVFHDIFNDEEGYGALSFMDDYLLNSSGEITKQVPVNIESYNIIAAKSKQVDNRELIFYFMFRKKLNFGKIEF